MPDQTAPYRLFPFGQDGILIRFGDDRAADPQAALHHAGRLRGAGISGVTEIASSLASVQVRFAPDITTRAALEGQLQAFLSDPTPQRQAPQDSRLWTIPACFGGAHGPQLAEAAKLASLTPDAAIAELTTTDLSVLAIGFAPGQPYLGFLPENWAMERQPTLTPQVPVGSLVVALRQVVMFANPSPTGWRWVGHCAFRPFVADRADPVALRAGDRIRFVATDASTLAGLESAPDGLGGAQCHKGAP